MAQIVKAKNIYVTIMFPSLSFCINGYNPKAQLYMAIKYNNYKSELAPVFTGPTQGCG